MQHSACDVWVVAAATCSSASSVLDIEPRTSCVHRVVLHWATTSSSLASISATVSRSCRSNCSACGHVAMHATDNRSRLYERQRRQQRRRPSCAAEQQLAAALPALPVAHFGGP